MKPQPVVESTVCSECGLDWNLHERANKDECIRLLKAELVRRPQWSYTTSGYQGIAVPQQGAVSINGYSSNAG